MIPSRRQEHEFVFEACARSARQTPTALAAMGWKTRDRGLRRICDRYYDTSSLTLYQAGVALRLREGEGKSELTLKTIAVRSVGNGMNRMELTQDAGRPGMAVRRIAATVLGRQVACILDGRALREILVLSQKRHVIDVECPKGGLVQVSVDRVAAPGVFQKARWRIEAEVMCGPVREARRVARQLERTLRLTVAGTSKLESALEQTGLRLPRPPVDEAPPFAARDLFGIAGGRVLRLQLQRLLWFAPGTRLGMNPEALHRLHTTVRRLRTALLVFGPALPARALSALNGDLRWLGGVLSRARDGDVQAAMLGLESSAEGGGGTLELYRAWVEHERSKTRRAVRRALDTRRYERMLGRVRRLADSAAALAAGTGLGTQPLAQLGPRLIREAWRKVIQRGRRAQRHGCDDEALHKVRISCKRLRYLCEFLGAGSGVAVSGKLAVRATALQNCLGAQQDAFIAGRWMQKFLHDTKRPDDSHRAALAAPMLRQAAQRRAQRKRFARLWRRFDLRKLTPR